MTTTYRKKLIEVALPLDAINKASAREKKPIRPGHPSAMHVWWARRPLATCRAVLFASLIDDPSEHPEMFPTEQDQEKERNRLFKLMEQLVQWENSNNEDVLGKAHAEILKSTNGNPPPVLDPFAGGGSIPQEAQRLGLEAHASDLNPVAVLINKALIEIPPKFVGRPPVNLDAHQSLLGSDWYGSKGLANDIRYYIKWMYNEAKVRIGHLYPTVTLPKELGGGKTTVIAWLWAKTVVCPNPACNAQMPLIRSLWLSKKKKDNGAWIELKINYTVKPPAIYSSVMSGKGKPQGGTVNRQGATCAACCTPVSFEYIRTEGIAGRIGLQLIAIVAEGQRGRIYLPPDEKHTFIFEQANPDNIPDTNLPEQALGFRIQRYGMTKHKDLFIPRQLVALTTFSSLIQEAKKRILIDAIATGWRSDNVPLNMGGTGANAYADAIAVYLAIAVDRLATYSSAICSWDSALEKMRNTFARQAISMIWDLAEVNPFSSSTGNFQSSVDWVATAVEVCPSHVLGYAIQQDATTIYKDSTTSLISTDPPYYDNIGYADLSDFYYTWLRRSLNMIYPDLFSTVLVPKLQELIATPFRFGGDKKMAQRFFEDGLGKAFERMRMLHNPEYPLTVYYAFKQAESDIDEEDTASYLEDSSHMIASTGWETMLEGLIKAGFVITGTWPVRTEMTHRTRGLSSNALASSIVLVCRPRPLDAPVASRRQFLNALRAELPLALKNLQHGSIAPVDLAQASIGPGMAIYSRYSKVVESDGTTLSVRTALQLINRALDEVLAEQEGEYDPETRWAVAWFEEYAMNAGEYGRAETLSKAKNTSVQSLVHAGFLEAKGGKVRLLSRDELAETWDPQEQRHLTVWEVMQRMISAQDKKGDTASGDILRRVGEKAEIARDLAYRLYAVCERKGWSQEALAYNSLVVSWSEISRLANREASDGNLWDGMFLG